MNPEFKHKKLDLVSPDFDSTLMDALFELNHLRRFQLGGSTRPQLFFELKQIFHLLESVGSARIEGNRTTISEYIEQKVEQRERSQDRFSEIANVEKALEYIEESIDVGFDISHQFIRELHQLAVDGLSEEGDRTPGAYRTWNVEIAQSSHKPPDSLQVQDYMNELVEFINLKHDKKFDLIKVAVAHHRFAWVHPFGNGNGRVVRLLTYGLLIKYGFRVKQGQLLNPTAVFCNDREKYYQMLATADRGSRTATLAWCEYVLTGICEEINKVNRLLDHEYLANKVLKPSIVIGHKRGLVNSTEKTILIMGIEKQHFKSLDIAELFPELTSRQRTHIIKNLKSNRMISPIKPNGREYFVSFLNNYLLRVLIQVLEKEKFIPNINE